MVPIRSRFRRGLPAWIAAAGFVAAFAGGSDLAGADDLSAAETRSLQEQFEKRQSSLQMASVDFSQTLSLAGLRRPAVSRGRILYASRGRLLIEYQQPAGDFVLLPGDGTLVSRKGNRPIVAQKLEQMDGRTRRGLTLLLSLFEGKLPVGITHPRFEARREGEHRVIVTMTPQASAGAPADGVERIETTLVLPALDPAAVSIRLAGGAEMRYDFGQIERRAKLSPDAFSAPPSP